LNWKYLGADYQYSPETTYTFENGLFSTPKAVLIETHYRPSNGQPFLDLFAALFHITFL
jgi:hypothetical protein